MTNSSCPLAIRIWNGESPPSLELPTGMMLRIRTVCPSSVWDNNGLPTARTVTRRTQPSLELDSNKRDLESQSRPQPEDPDRVLFGVE